MKFRGSLAVLVLGLVALWVACSRLVPAVPSFGGTIVIEAQTLPIVKTVAWDAVPDPCLAFAPVTCPTLTYTVSLDNIPVGTVPATQLTQAVSFPNVGPHAVCVSAANTWGSGSPGCINVQVVVPGRPQPRIP